MLDINLSYYPKITDLALTLSPLGTTERCPSPLSVIPHGWWRGVCYYSSTYISKSVLMLSALYLKVPDIIGIK
jgi:hypothetical protein